MNNPYQSPQSRVSAGDGGDIESVAAGQKLVIYAVLAYFFAAALRVVIGPLAFLVLFVSLGLAIAGIVKLGEGLGFSTLAKIGCVVLMFVPLVGLIMLLVLNSKATARLRAAGYRVGFLGVDR